MKGYLLIWLVYWFISGNAFGQCSIDGESFSEDGGSFIMNGSFAGSFPVPNGYYQQIINAYNILMGRLDKFPGTKLTEQQEAFLKDNDINANTLFPFPCAELTELQKAFLNGEN